MPGQRHTARSRTRGSWLPRLAGLGVIVLLAAGGAVTYIVEFHPGQARHPAPLPSRVASTQTIGLVAEPGLRSGSDGTLIQLLSPQHSPAFAPVGISQQQDGQPEWIADLMTGGGYIFIYLPTSECLASAGTGARARLTVQRCDLGTEQRWRQLGAGVEQGGHDFYQFANLASGKCIAQLGAATSQGRAAGLSACDSAQPASQLLAFWWTAD
jgi:hypothetical protein